MDSGETAHRMMQYGDVFHNNPIISPIMMRFRPIAPKPVAGGVLGGLSDESRNALISRGRTKRKYVRVRKYNRKKKTTKSDDNNKTSDQFQVDHSTVNLQLLPGKSSGVDFLTTGSLPSNSDGTAPYQNQTEPRFLTGNSPQRADRREEVRGAKAGELWLTVECVTDACMDLQQHPDLGSTDEERINNLETDTCPAFVSDGCNRVEWLNAAFKRMVRQRQLRQRSDTAEIAAVAVWLIWNAGLAHLGRGFAFTCQIKLQYKWGMDLDRDSQVVPCDVWRMDGGGFAWKLDVKAALTLGPPLQD